MHQFFYSLKFWSLDDDEIPEDIESPDQLNKTQKNLSMVNILPMEAQIAEGLTEFEMLARAGNVNLFYTYKSDLTLKID